MSNETQQQGGGVVQTAVEAVVDRLEQINAEFQRLVEQIPGFWK